MPPKQKVNRGSAKSKISKPQTLTEKKECSEEIPSLSIETQQQFEMEICWCIQQLQAALKSGKLNPKQGSNLLCLFRIFIFLFMYSSRTYKSFKCVDE